jgi:chemotaxis protein CheZ
MPLAPSDPPEEMLAREVRAEVEPLLAELRRFVDRRVAELSAEVHGAVQMLDFSESNLSGQLGRIHDEVARMITAPSEATRNSGLELEAVVQATEAAANQIMEAAEAISDWLRAGTDDPAALRGIAARIETIFEACSFQDLTGQRIRRAIEHLQHVEQVLTGMIQSPTGEPAAPELAEPRLEPDLRQRDIDALLGAAQAR